MRFQRILVPLDGSRLAEASLAPAEEFARQLGSVLVLVHVLEADPPTAVHGERHLATLADAEAYLEAHRARCSALGLAAETHVADTGAEDVSLAIEELAGKLDAGVVAMCAHGRQTLRGKFIGPIAQRTLRAGSVAILLRTAGAATDIRFELKRILLPIDFRHDLEVSLSAAGTLARGFAAPVTLLHSSERAGGLQARLLPSASTMVRALDEQEAGRRLAVLAERLRADGIETLWRASEQPADDLIIEEIDDRASVLTVLVTHGRSGIAAWYERSIGQRMIEEPGLTLMLVRESGAA